MTFNIRQINRPEKDSVMKIVLHAGVKCTDEERLLTTLRSNKDLLAQRRVAVPIRAITEDEENILKENPERVSKLFLSAKGFAGQVLPEYRPADITKPKRKNTFTIKM